jgi:acyl dehydratase
MPVEEPLVTDEARALIGKETTADLGEVTLRDAQRYAVAVGDMNPLYFDEDLARGSAYGGIIAPPNFLTAVIHWGCGPPEDELRPDGLPPEDELRLPLRGVSRVMGAGQEIECLLPVRPGDRFTRVSKIVDVAEQKGRRGRFVLVTTEQRYVNQRGEVAVVCLSRFIVR